MHRLGYFEGTNRLTALYRKRYTLYRPSTDYSELHLVCYSHSTYYSTAVWNWGSRQRQNHQKQIAAARYSEPISVNSIDFRNRLVTSLEQFNGKNFNMRIVPVLFGDSGVYTCSLESNTFPTIELITVKVTAEPSDTLTEGDTVTLSCSVSAVTASTRLVWINGDGETVGDKTLTGEEKSLSLIVQKAERGRGKWMCGVFDQDRLRIIVPYYQEHSVEADSQRPVMGSDVTLSCTISRLPDTVSLHWKPVGSSQRNNTDQIHLNDTVYLMVRHVTVEDGKLYQCEVRENGNIVLTSKADFTVDTALYQQRYTLYRPSTDYSELHLVCYSRYTYYSTAVWNWGSRQQQNHQKQMAAAKYSEPISVHSAKFGNRLLTSVKLFNGKNLSERIVPVLFGDAGIYTCSLGSTTFLTIKLITVKVTAEPSDTVTEEDTVTLSCSVSDVTASTRLVWINGDGETVGDKTLTGEEKSLSLIVQKAERGRGKWTCGVFDQDRLRIIVPYYQELSGIGNSVYFLHQEGNFVLKGPDNPGSDSIDLEWRPHTGQQTTKRLATFHREGQRWAVQWSDEFSKIPDISQRLHVDWGTLNLRIREPTFELAGLFTWNRMQPGGKILRQWEVFGIKVEADSQRPEMGSDVTLSCTISRLPDTVSLHWKPRGSSQRNSNTDQIHLNNTVYLMVRHVGTGDPSLYTWEVQENDSIVLTGDTNVGVDEGLHNKIYRVYRSDIDHSELKLICETYSEFYKTKWTWKSHLFQNQEMEIATSYRSQPINISRMSYFENRLRSTEENLHVKNFSMRIVPVQFEDAGVYTCSLGSHQYVTIDLITVKVTAEPPNAVTEGDTVTLTCSVSEGSESMRLVWINSDDEIVDEKIFMERKNKGDSLQLIIPTDDKVQRKWTCALFHQTKPKIFIPHYLQVNNAFTSEHIILVITRSLVLLIFMILTVVFCRQIYKISGLGKQKLAPPKSNRNTKDESHRQTLMKSSRYKVTPRPALS
ncbi:uncharacterized protein [Mobula birostris]|uniref:uncharacterized protein n=1 Tax=Mobula birostris TaxID=1983395 RepID=UPI003B27EDF1